MPNLLVNGTSGIAVGMATNIPPHNLREIINAVVKIIENKIGDRETTIEEVLEVVKGPDFPTGAMILGTRGIEEAYRNGYRTDGERKKQDYRHRASLHGK